MSERTPVTWKYMQTYGGRRIYLDADLFDPNAINVNDVALALPHINRYVGHSRYAYSVAQHCLALSYAAERAGMGRNEIVWFFIHDWPEYITNDIVSPFKRGMPLITALDARILSTLAERYNLTPEMPDICHEWDQRICRNEMDVFGNANLPDDEKWWRALAPISFVHDQDLQPENPDTLRGQFINRILELRLA